MTSQTYINIYSKSLFISLNGLVKKISYFLEMKNRLKFILTDFLHKPTQTLNMDLLGGGHLTGKIMTVLLFFYFQCIFSVDCETSTFRPKRCDFHGE